MRFVRLAAICVFFASVAAGCALLPPAVPEPFVPPPSVEGLPSVVPSVPSESWTEVAPGVERWEGVLPGTEARLLLYRFEAGRFAWHAAAGPFRSMAEWANALPEAVFVANGGYFHEDGTPSGYLRAGGERVGERAFDPDRSAFLLFGDAPSMQEIGIEEAGALGQDVVQSYPVLIRAGQPAVTSDSGLAARRTLFGTDGEGNAYVGIMPDRSATLYQLSEGLAHLPIEWADVLNMDGGSSTGAVLRPSAPGASLETIPSFLPVPNVFYAVPLAP